jgi:uncharacterized protein (DUF305 family)
VLTNELEGEMFKRAVLVGTGAIAALLIAGCGGTDSGSDSSSGHSEGHGSSATSATAAPSAGDHNDADVMFAQHMIPHHRQAVEMSDVVLAKQGVDPRITELAKAIKAAQDPEIKQMQDWLNQWGNPPMPPMGATEGGHDMDGMSGDAMGMMSDEEMTALKNAQGGEANRLFLTGMITHHEGAIDMAQTEIEDGTFTPAIEMARTIVQTQKEEIDTMKGILETL